MKLAKQKLRQIIQEELKKIIQEERNKLFTESRYASSHDEKTAAAAAAGAAGRTIDDLEMLLDQEGGRFTDAEFSVLNQALELLNSRLRE